MNWRLFFQLSLLSALMAGLAPPIVQATQAPATKPSTTKSPATKSPATKTPAPKAVVAQNNVTASAPFPWLIGGGAAVAVTGGAIGLYRLGRNSGKQAAQVDRAVTQYRTLAELGPAAPSQLEESLSQIKTARPPTRQITDQELAAEQAEFASDLHEYDAAQFVEPLDIDQLDAAFADVDGAEPLTATEQVLPMADRTRLMPIETSIATPIAAPMTIATPVTLEARHTTLEARVVPTPSTKPAVHAAAIVVPTTVVTDEPRSRAIDGELVTRTPTMGLGRPSRLPQVGAVENLLKEIQNPDPVKRRKAIWDLGQWGDTRAVEPLVDLMIEADSKQRSLILSALSEIGTRTIKPMSKALAISLQDDSADVRKNAIRDLTRIYDLVAQISQMVQKCAIDDPEEEVRDTANWALKQLNRIRPVGLDEHSFAVLSGSASSASSSAPESIG